MLAYLIYGVTAVPTCLLNHLWAYTRCHVAQFLDKTEKNNAYQFVFISLEQFLPRLKRVPGRSSLICDLFIQRLSIGKFIGNKEKHYCRHLFTINLCCLKDLRFFGDFFSVRFLSVLRGHSVFSSPPQRPMTSDFKGFSIPEFIHYIYFPILILEKEPVFSLLNVHAVLNKGTTGTILITSLVWHGPWLGIDPGPPALEASTIPLGFKINVGHFLCC